MSQKRYSRAIFDSAIDLMVNVTSWSKCSFSQSIVIHFFVGYSRNALCALNLISMFFYYHCVDTSAGWLLVSEGIIRPVVGATARTWSIRYIYYWNLQFINNVNINHMAKSCSLFYSWDMNIHDVVEPRDISFQQHWDEYYFLRKKTIA
jgi:hypothetical protein